jgi:uracil-DNA glycosylase
MFHPAYLLPGRSPESRRDFWDDLKLVLSRVGRPAPATPPRMETW